MNENNYPENKMLIPIPPRHIVEKFNWAFIEVSHKQLILFGAGAMVSIIIMAISAALSFPFNTIGYIALLLIAYLFFRYARTHDRLMESQTMLEYWWYKRKGLMDIPYTDVYSKIKTLFPYEIRDVRNGIISFGNNKFGIIVSMKPRKMSPEELAEFTPVVERLINSLPPEMIFKVRARTKIVSGNILEKMVFQQLQTVKTKEEKALLFSLYDKSKDHESNQKWEHTLFIGIESTDDEVETYVQTILPGIVTMLQSSRVLCTHIIDPIKILGHYSGDFSMRETNNENQSVVLDVSKRTNPLSQMIHGGARFEQDHINYDGEHFAQCLVVGLPQDLVGGWPDNLDNQVLPRIYALSDTKLHIIEINATLKPVEPGVSMDEIKGVLSTIEVNKAGNKTTSNIRVLNHSEKKYGAILEMLQDGKVRLNEVSYIITVKAHTKENLRAGISKVRAILNASSIKSQRAKGNTKDVFMETRFFPIYHENFSTCMPTEAIARVLPLMNGSENISSSNPGKYSVYFGDDIKTKTEYIFNIEEMAANHAVGFGATQGGKTTFLSIIGLRMVLAGIKVIYTTVKQDSNTRSFDVAEYLKDRGEVICLGRPPTDKSSPHYSRYKNLNPLQILFDPTMLIDAKQTFFQHVTILKQFINQLCVSGSTTDDLNSLQMAYVERTILRVYAKFGISITDTTTWTQEKQPTLIDLYNIWSADKELDSKESVQAAVVESRTTPLTHNWDFLSQKTTISLNRDYTVIDMSTLPSDLTNAMNYFMTAIIALRFRADITHKSVILVDEGRAFMKSNLGEAIVKMATTGASQGVSVWFTSQQPKDMANISTELLNNSFIRFVMGNNTEVQEVATTLKLSQSDQNFLASCNRPGQFLLQMKSPFSQTYHLELNLSALESEILFGKKQEAEATFKFLTPELATFSNNRGFVNSDWIMANSSTSQHTKNMKREFVQRSVGLGKVWVYLPEGFLDEKGNRLNQSSDHYISTSSIAGWLIGQGLQVKVNDYEDVDISFALPNGKTVGLEYQTSLPNNNTQDRVVQKLKTGIAGCDFFYFVSDSIGTKEIRSVLKSDENIIPRGSRLEEKLLELIAENK